MTKHPKPSARLGVRFSLRQRTILVVATTLLTVTSLLVVFSQTIVRQGFEKVESRDVKLNIDRIRDAFAMQVENVDVKIIDWSMWDDAYQFMQDGNVGFEKSSLALIALLGMKVELFVWLLPDGRLRWGREFDLVNGTERALDPKTVAFFNAHPELFRFKDEATRHTGLVDIPLLGPSFFAAHPIITSEGKGPIAGALIAVRALNKAMVERLEKLTHLDLELRMAAEAAKDQDFTSHLAALKTPNDSVIVPIDEEFISGYTMFSDMFGRPVAYVKMKAPREIHAQGQATVTAFFTALGLASLALGFVILWMLERSVVSRVAKLSSQLTHLRSSSDLSLRVAVAGRDEITVLSQATNDMLASIEVGHKKVAARNNDMKLILDNADQGFVNVARDGSLVGERSEIVAKWLGEPQDGEKIWVYLHRDHAKHAKFFQLGWDQILDDFLPFDVVADQMPSRVHRDGEIFQAKLRPVQDGEKLASILLIISNVTEAVKAELKEREQQEMMRVFLQILADKNAVVEFFEETRSKVSELLAARDSMPQALQMRIVHTLKGNAAQQGIETFTKICHDLESKMVEEESQLTTDDAKAIADAWQDVEARFKPLVDQNKASELDISRHELDTAFAMAQSQKSDQALLDLLHSWLLDPVLPRLQRLAKLAEDVGARLGKDGLEVAVKDGGLRLEGSLLRDFWASMVHVLRNAIDHGIELPEERLAKGKPAHGTIVLSAYYERDYVVIEVADDGKGIHWQKLAAIAQKRNLPHATQSDLINVLFADGTSTKEEVTELSGRGVGMAAVKQSVHRLGGGVKVHSKVDHGTTFSFYLPRATVQGGTRSSSEVLRQAS